MLHPQGGSCPQPPHTATGTSPYRPDDTSWGTGRPSKHRWLGKHRSPAAGTQVHGTFMPRLALPHPRGSDCNGQSHAAPAGGLPGATRTRAKGNTKGSPPALSQGHGQDLAFLLQSVAGVGGTNLGSYSQSPPWPTNPQGPQRTGEPSIPPWPLHHTPSAPSTGSITCRSLGWQRSDRCVPKWLKCFSQRLGFSQCLPTPPLRLSSTWE